MEQEKRKGFTVKDKRSFDGAGESRQEDEQSATESSTGEKMKEPVGAAAAEERTERTGDDFLAEVNFYNFILSLSTSAIYHFGDFPDPESKMVNRDLAAAKHTIDILSMLKEKTAGNLEEHEKNLLEGVLFELKMRYVREKAAG